MIFLLSPSAADPAGLFASVEITVKRNIPEGNVDGAFTAEGSLLLWDILAGARDATPEHIEEIRKTLGGGTNANLSV